MKKLLLVLLPVLVALAAHYHRQGNLALPPQLQGPAEELWQQLRVHLPLNVPANPLRGDTSAKQATPTQGTTAKVGGRQTCSLGFDMQTWLLISLKQVVYPQQCTSAVHVIAPLKVQTWHLEATC